MSIATELNKLEQNRQDIVGAVNAKGGELAENAPLNAIAQAIEALPSGGGEIVTGRITITSPTNKIQVLHNKGIAPIYGVIERTPSLVENNTSYAAGIFYMPSGNMQGFYRNYIGSGAIAGGFTNINIINDDVQLQVFSGTAARMFQLGEYEYNLIFL